MSLSITAGAESSFGDMPLGWRHTHRKKWDVCFCCGVLVCDCVFTCVSPHFVYLGTFFLQGICKYKLLSEIFVKPALMVIIMFAQKHSWYHQHKPEERVWKHQWLWCFLNSQQVHKKYTSPHKYCIQQKPLYTTLNLSFTIFIRPPINLFFHLPQTHIVYISLYGSLCVIYWKCWINSICASLAPWAERVTYRLNIPLKCDSFNLVWGFMVHWNGCKAAIKVIQSA